MAQIDEFNNGWQTLVRTHAADGRIFAAGGTYSGTINPGSTGSTSLASFYDRVDDSWTDVAPMPERRSSHTLDLLFDSSVLAAGGELAQGLQLGSASNALETAVRYFPEDDSWEPAGELNEPRIQHTSIMLDSGSVLIIGGRSGPTSFAKSVEVYDPEINTWDILVHELPVELAVGQVVLMPDGCILVFGGFDRDDEGQPVYDGTNAWSLDPDTGAISQLLAMNTSRTDFSAVMLSNGSVLVTGGRDAGSSDNSPLSSAELYVPDQDEWMSVSPMEHARVQHQSVALDEPVSSAAALVFGGISGQSSAGLPKVFYLDTPGIADRQPPPADDDPAHRYFSATGHYLSFGFKDFWDASGGLPAFGYPLTTEFDEFNPDLDEHRTSQYVERQRFEYHPEHAGTVYEVQLGRLGFAEAVERDLFESDGFAPVDQGQVDSDCVYFPQTEQAVCGAFLSYWQTHGLDFGDAGVSFRESLALFGYPISQEFVDSDSGLVTQYFERARFEYHPDNPEEYRVLLGLLGADIVDQRDW